MLLFSLVQKKDHSSSTHKWCKFKLAGAMKQQQEGLVKHTLERGPRLLRYSDLSSGIMKIQVSKFRTQFQRSKDFYICQPVVSFFL